MITLLSRVDQGVGFLLSAYFPLACKVSAKKLVNSVMEVPLNVAFCFSLDAFYILFYTGVMSISLSSRLLIFSVSTNLLLIPSNVFFTSIIAFFSSVFFIYIFSHSLLKFSLN